MTRFLAVCFALLASEVPAASLVGQVPDIPPPVRAAPSDADVRFLAQSLPFTSFVNQTALVQLLAQWSAECDQIPAGRFLDLCEKEALRNMGMALMPPLFPTRFSAERARLFEDATSKIKIEDISAQYAEKALATKFTVIKLPAAGGQAKLGFGYAGLGARADGKVEAEQEAASRALLTGGTMSLTWDLPWLYLGPKQNARSYTVLGKLRLRGIGDVQGPDGLNAKFASGLQGSLDLLYIRPLAKGVTWHFGLLGSHLMVDSTFNERLPSEKASGSFLMAQAGIRITGSISLGLNVVLASGGIFANITRVYPNVF